LPSDKWLAERVTGTDAAETERKAPEDACNYHCSRLRSRQPGAFTLIQPHFDLGRFGMFAFFKTMPLRPMRSVFEERGAIRESRTRSGRSWQDPCR